MSGVERLFNHAPSAWQAPPCLADDIVLCTVPVPPSVNRGYRNRGVKDKARRNWEDFAHTHLRLQRLPVFPRDCVLVVGFERPSLSADADNRIKPLQDILVRAGVLSDDNLVLSVTGFWLPPASGFAHVAIVPGDVEFSMSFHPSPKGAAGAWLLAPLQQKDFA